jgi:uncharacterized membrane protein
MLTTTEITMMKRQALLIAIASALAFGAVTTSFAQEAVQNGNGSYSQYSSQYGSNQYVPGYGNTGAGSGPGGY